MLDSNNEITSIFDIKSIFNDEKESSKKFLKWTKEEDLKLMSLVENNVGKLNWGEISSYFSNKNKLQCYSRYRQINPNLKKGAWTMSEEKILRDCIKKYGKNWAKIAAIIQTRSGKQIRDHYVYLIDSNKGHFTEEEDNIIKNLFLEYGNQFSKFTEFLPGRSSESIKNRFHSSIKKKLINGTSIMSSDNLKPESKLEELTDTRTEEIKNKKRSRQKTNKNQEDYGKVFEVDDREFSEKVEKSTTSDKSSKREKSAKLEKSANKPSKPVKKKSSKFNIADQEKNKNDKDNTTRIIEEDDENQNLSGRINFIDDKGFCKLFDVMININSGEKIMTSNLEVLDINNGVEYPRDSLEGRRSNAKDYEYYSHEVLTTLPKKKQTEEFKDFAYNMDHMDHYKFTKCESAEVSVDGSIQSSNTIFSYQDLCESYYSS